MRAAKTNRVKTIIFLYFPHPGLALIDGSPLKPLSEDAPEKRKHRDDSTEEDEEDDDDEEEMQGVEEDPYKYLREGVEYDSQEDEDYKVHGLSTAHPKWMW